MIFFTADQHFNHLNSKGAGIIQYQNRPFSDINEMNETLITNWNRRITSSDLVYILGDFCFRNSDQFLKRLNGKKILIKGDHDQDPLRFKDQFVKIEKMEKITEKGQTITLCHYCMRVWPKSHWNSWHLFAHSHGRLEPIGKSWDVGVDNNHFEVLSFDEIKLIMDTRPDNFNLVKNAHA